MTKGGVETRRPILLRSCAGRDQHLGQALQHRKHFVICKHAASQVAVIWCLSAFGPIRPSSWWGHARAGKRLWRVPSVLAPTTLSKKPIGFDSTWSGTNAWVEWEPRTRSTRWCSTKRRVGLPYSPDCAVRLMPTANEMVGFCFRYRPPRGERPNPWRQASSVDLTRERTCSKPGRALLLARPFLGGSVGSVTLDLARPRGTCVDFLGARNLILE